MKRPVPLTASWRALSSGAKSTRTDPTPNLLLSASRRNEEDFQMLLDFLKRGALDRVGCFKYSPVERRRRE